MTPHRSLLPLFAIIVSLSACVHSPLDVNRAPLDEARHLIAQAQTAGAEQCAPQEQARAVASLKAAAHELEEADDIHWQRNQEALQQSIESARAALRKCGTVRPNIHPQQAQQSPEQPVIYFAYRSARLTRNEQQKLRDFIGHHPKGRISIEGHADERGSDPINLQLSQRRARTVARFLRRHGIPNQQIARIIGFGKSRPVAKGHDESAWHLNRRTEIHPF